MKKIVKVKNLSFRYPEAAKPALKDINLEVHQGEILLLAGETGSGKSTLLSVLSGLIPSQAAGEFRGQVEILHHSWPVSPQDLFPQVVTVFQNPGEHLIADTVFSEIAFGLENLGLDRKEIKKRVSIALGQVGLSGFEKRRLTELSGGERQRVALAAALALDARVLLLDEPLAQLDPEAARQIMALLKGLSRQGLTIILAEHRLNYALDFVDQICFLRQGKLTYRGSKDTFTPPPRRPFSLPQKPRGPLLLEIKDLFFGYHHREIFKGLSLSFYKNEIVALLGTNGSGKTTFLHLLAGLLTPKKGKIIWHLPPLKGRLACGLLLQDPDLMLLKETVEAELRFSPENLGLYPSEIEKRIKDISDKLGLIPYLPRPPFSLSQGERLRTALAGLLTGKPAVLLLDEPTTAQDPENMKRLLQALEADLIIFSTHEEEIAFHLAGRVFLFREGKVEEIKK